jgi:hypothetical protein
VIAPSRAAAYRRFYLYSALSVAVIAIAVAAALLLRLGLAALGFGLRVPPDDASRNVSLAIALLAVALPVGAAHLWLILRSFADPAERATGVRHQYLNLWVAFGLLIVLFAGQAAFGVTAQDGGDATIPVSVLAVAAVVSAIAAWWIARTPPDDAQPRIRAAVVVMLVAMTVGAFSIANAGSGLGGIFQNASAPISPTNSGFGPPGPGKDFGGYQRYYQEQAFRTGLLTTGLALLVWSFGFTWQRRWNESRDRLGYGLLFYGVGTVVLLIGAAYELAGAVRYAGDPSRVGAFTSVWSAVAAGALLVATHVTLLLRDRGRNGHPAITTDRLLLAFPALVGLGMAVAGLGFGWHALLERDTVPADHYADDIAQAAALGLVGLVFYVPAWRAFRARTTADSAVRRFHLFSVVCLALVAGLIGGVIGLYSAITALTGTGDRDAARTALTWVVPVVALAAIFARHLALLLRDQRQTHAAEVAPAADPLIVLLEDVRAGRVSVERAAETIRRPAP